MSQNSGWIQRVFGTTEVEERFRRANQLLADKERRLLELEQQVESLGSEAAEKLRKADDLERQVQELRDAAQAKTSRTGEHEKRLTEALTRAGQERASLEAVLAETTAKLAQMTAKLAESERDLKNTLAREAELGKSVAANHRRAELLATELEQLEQKLAANAQAAQKEKTRWEATLAARDAELGDNTDTISAAEWKIATLESELSQAKAEVQQSRSAERAHAQRLEEVRREQARALTFAEQRKILLAQTREALFDILRLSAHALQRTLGAGAHLAIEVAAASCSPKQSKTFHETAEAVLELRNRLAFIGVAEEFTARSEGAGYAGRFKISMAVPPNEAPGLARWVAAYAIEVLNGTTPEPLRLETLDGGPTEFQFSAAPRRATTPSLRANVTPARDPKAPDPQRGSDARYE